MSKNKNSNTKTALAILLVVAGTGVLGVNIWKQSQGPTAYEGPDDYGMDGSDLPPLGDELEDHTGMDSPDARPDDESRSTHRLGVDLLALCGSFERGKSVPDRFRSLAIVADASTTPAPGVEQMPQDSIRWETEPDPPEMVVSLTMRTGGVARASIDGAIVGVGDRVAAGEVTRIEEHGIEVDTGRYRLFYDMDMPFPREFRAELARRLAEQEQNNEPSDADDPAAYASTIDADPAGGANPGHETGRK